jgi:hypothetical protein
MAASLTKTQSYVASEWEVQTTATALTVTLVEDDYLWIRQTLSTDDPEVTPTLSLMEIELTEAISVATPINLQGTPEKYQIEWTWQEGSLE